MTDTTTLHATTSQLLKATAVAVLASGAILLTTVLPAEYGIDPTGIGKMLGLSALHRTAEVSETAAPVAVVAAPAETVIRQGRPFQNGEMSLTLQPNQGAEIKARMREGESFVFSWATDGGEVNFDMHGERPNAGSDFTSYWQDKLKTEGHGSFIAPFDGSHGWYWKNKSGEPLTLTLKISGYYEKLYQPN